MNFDPITNPWDVGGEMYASNALQSTPAQRWQQGNQYWQPKSQAELQKEGLLQLAVLAAVLVAPAVAGAIGGGAAAGAAGAGSAGAATSAQAAGGAIVQGAGAAAGGFSMGLGALAAITPFLSSSVGPSLLQSARHGMQQLDQDLRQMAPFPWSQSSQFEWQSPRLHPATELLRVLQNRLANSPHIRPDIQAGIPTQQVESMVKDALEERAIRDAVPTPPLQYMSPDSGAIPDSWWKGQGFGRGFVAGLFNSLVEGGVSVWEGLQLNYATLFPYYDWIFEGGDTHKAAWNKMELIWALSTDAELRELAADNISELFDEWVADASFEGDPSDSGYLYGSLIPDIIFTLLSDGGYSVKQIISALRKGGRELRKLFGEIGKRGYGYSLFVDDLQHVLEYLQKLPLNIREELIPIFRNKKFLMQGDKVFRSSYASNFDSDTGVYRIASWYVEVAPDFRGQGIYKAWIQKRVLDARNSGANTFIFDHLNVGNTRLINYLKSLESSGWRVEIIPGEDVSPLVRTVLQLR